MEENLKKMSSKKKVVERHTKFDHFTYIKSENIQKYSIIYG